MVQQCYKKWRIKMYEGLKEKLLIDLSDRTYCRVDVIKEQIDKLKTFINNGFDNTEDYDTITEIEKELRKVLYDKYSSEERMKQKDDLASDYSYYYDMKDFCDSIKKMCSLVNHLEHMKLLIVKQYKKLKEYKLFITFRYTIKLIDRIINDITLYRDFDAALTLLKKVEERIAEKEPCDEFVYICRSMYFDLKSVYC